MKKLIFKFVFGADEIVERMFNLVQTRAEAVDRHVTNKNLKAALANGEEHLENLKNSYHEQREALERAYKLELD